MEINRRQFILSSAAVMMLPRIGMAAEKARTLSVSAIQSVVNPDFEPVMLWGVEGASPGPILRFKKGERVQINLENKLEWSSSMHWHGMRIDNKMDGAAGFTQEPVAPGQSFLYDFVVPDAGSYWYHAHDHSLAQVAMGIYGPIIIEEENPPKVDHDLVIVIDDWLLDDQGRMIENFEDTHDLFMSGILGNYAKAVVMGQESDLMVNHRVRLRLVNTATDRVFTLKLAGVQGKIVAYDGMPLGAPEDFGDLVLPPARRIDIIADVTEDKLVFDMISDQAGTPLLEIAAKGIAEMPDYGAIAPLEPNRYAKPVLDGVTPHKLLMGGGAHNPKSMTMSMDHSGMDGMNWTFNGNSALDETPLASFKTGATGIIDLVNDTAFAHAIHLHGHHFQVLKDGELGALLDTVLVDVGETAQIVAVFDNPGKWLLHCHMLGHQSTGMVTWVDVA